MAKSSPQKKSYLEKIKFDPKLWLSPVAKYITNIRIVILLVITIIALGIYGYVKLPKRLNPEIKIPIVTVITVLPGASPEDIESLVTIPLENAINGIKGIDQLASVSRESVSAITIQFFSTVDQEKAKNDVQSKIDGITDLPTDAQKPAVKALDFEDQPIWVFALSSHKDLPSLMYFSENLKRKIDRLSKVDRVMLTGFENQEISVVIKPEKITQYGINPLLVSQALQKSTVSYPAGNTETTNNSFSLAIDPQVQTVEDIRRIRITAQGEVITLGDIAVISEKSKKDQNQTLIANQKKSGQRAVSFYIYKTSDSNIDEAGKQAKDLVDQEIKAAGSNFQLATITNTPEKISDQFNDLLKEFRSTIILIVLCLLIFLGLRQALISSLTVPLTFLSAFFIATFFNQSINFLTLFAFLIALGLLIDDTIVVVSAMTTYYKTGKFTPAETGLIVWRDTIIPIWSTTITTIWSFIPLLISTGIIGEFIKPIPIIVTAVMVSSTSIAVLITLPLMIVLLKLKLAHRVAVLIKLIGIIAGIIFIGLFTAGHPLFIPIIIFYLLTVFVFVRIRPQLTKIFGQKVKQNKFTNNFFEFVGRVSNKGLIDIEVLSRLYHRLILRVLNSKKARLQVIFIIVFYSVVSFMLLPLGLVSNEFFPKTDNEVIYVNLSLPPGTNVETTNIETKYILEKLRKTQETNFVIAEVGQQYSSSFNRSENSYSTLFTVHLPKEKERKDKSYTIAKKIRQSFSGYNKGTITVIELGAGPPAGADLQITLLGDDLGQLNQYADKIMSYLDKQSGVINIDKSIKQGTSRLVFVPDKSKLEANNIGIENIGFWMRSYLSGFTLQSINFDKRFSDKKDVVFKLESREVNPTEITGLSIMSPTGQSMPLTSLGVFVPKNNPTMITREDGKRTITVTAGVLPGFSTTKLNQGMEKYADRLKLAEGYSWKTGGVNEENQKSVLSILQAMVIAFILILITMVLQFQSYRQAIIVLMVIPLAVSSVFIVFAITGTPLSFPALIGILSLFGIVVTNSMFIVDKININLKEKMPFKEAIADAGASRLEPILLTKLNTILGLVPITLSNPLWQGLGGAIISGISLSSFIMLLFIPSVYYLWFKPESEL